MTLLEVFYSTMRKIILIILAMLFDIAVPFLFVMAADWAEMTGLPQKFYECSAVAAAFIALFLLVASNDNNQCRQDTNLHKSR